MLFVRHDDGDPIIWISPQRANRGPVPTEVPDEIKRDYEEACGVLDVSSKASAALARRCLQAILRGNGYKARDLAAEIDLMIADPRTPTDVSETIDAIRNFGNFSAHPINEVTTLQLVDVEPHEADWCLEILETLFDHFYVKPARAKERKAKLDAKLAAAGKPASKS